jgi:hypothetical protein
MLISWNRAILAIFVWSLDPIPASIAVTAETPNVVEATLISCPATEADHHTSRTACLTECCRVIDPHLRCFPSTIKLNPRERCLLNAEAPNVTDRFLSGITAKGKQMWLLEHDTVTISATWGRTYDWNNHPLRLLLTVSHIEEVQIVTRQTTAASRATINHHLHLFHICGGMGCSGRWCNTFDTELSPSF